MNRIELIKNIKDKGSYLIIGLDTDINKIPKHLLQYPDPIFYFNKEIIDNTKDLCIGYKINTAFYESLGVSGWETLERTVNYIPNTHFKIADAKRGDIGNTSFYYAKAFFETLNFDAITISPYMGSDSIIPFLEYKDKWTIVLGLTSNVGSNDFELIKVDDSKLYEIVLEKVSKLGSIDNLMFVTGATQVSEFENIRKIIPNHFLLVPGVGTQGGTVEDISKIALNNNIGLLVSVSRDIIYSSNLEDYGKKAYEKALEYQQTMSKIINKYNE